MAKQRKIRMPAYAKQYVRRRKQGYNNAKRLLKKGPLGVRLRRALTDAGVSPKFIANVTVVDESNIELFAELVGHEWIRLNEHLNQLFELDEVPALS